MNNSIKLAFVSVFAAAGIAACTSTPAPENNAAPQTSATPTSQMSGTPASEAPPSAAVVTETVTHTVTNPPKPQAVVKADNRLGHGAFKLGMSLEEARAAGLTDLTWDSASAPCVSDGKIAVSKKYGIERITLPLDGRTSKGIGVGSTFADVKRAYPDGFVSRDGWSAKISDNARYQFSDDDSFDAGNDAHEVSLIKLTSRLLDCANAQL